VGRHVRPASRCGARPAPSTAQEVALRSLNPALDEARYCPRCAAEAEIYSASPSTTRREVRAFTAEQLPWDELAFWSTEQALRDLLG